MICLRRKGVYACSFASTIACAWPVTLFFLCYAGFCTCRTPHFESCYGHRSVFSSCVLEEQGCLAYLDAVPYCVPWCIGMLTPDTLPPAGVNCPDSTVCCGGDGVTYANTCTPKSKGITYTPGPCVPVTPGACMFWQARVYTMHLDSLANLVQMGSKPHLLPAKTLAHHGTATGRRLVLCTAPLWRGAVSGLAC